MALLLNVMRDTLVPMIFICISLSLSTEICNPFIFASRGTEIGGSDIKTECGNFVSKCFSHGKGKGGKVKYDIFGPRGEKGTKRGYKDKF